MQFANLICSDRAALAASSLNTKKDILLNAAAYIIAAVVLRLLNCYRKKG